jgi:hypothetical protein
MTRVINFSGGRSSALMTILLKPTPDDIVIFCDTGREHPATYKFIDDFEQHEKIKIHRVTYTNKKTPELTGFEALNRSKVYLANRMRRICTAHLKVITAKRYLRPLVGTSFDQYIGFRYDEKNRVDNFKSTYKKVKTFFPLFNQRINKEMVNQYWLSKPYNLEIPSILGNCDLCFLKGKNVIIRILQHFPDLADKWIKDEEEMQARRKIKTTYFKDCTYKDLLNIANSQKTLFDVGNFEQMAPAYSCSCTS